MTSQLIVRFRDRILSGAYAPGSALRQDSLAAEFGTSKIPVREALVQLQSEGLVDIYPNRGFQVRPLDSAELDEVFRLRLQIEPGAVARGAKLAGAADHAAARTALDRLNEATAAGSSARPASSTAPIICCSIVPRLQPVAAEISTACTPWRSVMCRRTSGPMAGRSAPRASMPRCCAPGVPVNRGSPCAHACTHQVDPG